MESYTTVPEIDSEKGRRWVPELETVPPAAKELLSTYSQIPEEEMLSHIVETRKKAWEVSPYGCIGTFGFTSPTINRHWEYSSIISSMKEDSSMHLLDLGCGLGQNMRKLLVDGVPAAQLAGADVSAGLIACGHEYFRDADRWQCEMYIGNLFDAQARINHEASGRYDVIWAAMVYHLWAWDGQLKACIQTARLMKEKPGSFLFGWQLGATPAVVQKKLSLGWRRGTYINMFRHDEESFRKLWKEVTHETGIDFDVTTKVHFPDWIGGRDELEGSKGSVIAFKVARR